MRVYLINGTHARDGSYVVSDGDQSSSGQVLLADGISLLFAHHVTKAVKQKHKHIHFITSTKK